MIIKQNSGRWWGDLPLCAESFLLFLTSTLSCMYSSAGNRRETPSVNTKLHTYVHTKLGNSMLAPSFKSAFRHLKPLHKCNKTFTALQVTVEHKDYVRITFTVCTVTSALRVSLQTPSHTCNTGKHTHLKATDLWSCPSIEETAGSLQIHSAEEKGLLPPVALLLPVTSWIQRSAASGGVQIR